MIILSALINVLVVAMCVGIHYEFLFHLSKRLSKLSIKPKPKVVVGVFGALVAHAVEIWIFALVYFAKVKSDAFGHLEGNFEGTLLDCVYFSFTAFTTLGFGDIVPIGDIRFLTGIESLTGLVLITWSASFMFNEMQKYWSKS